jgi:hypothetical protein
VLDLTLLASFYSSLEHRKMQRAFACGLFTLGSILGFTAATAPAQDVARGLVFEDLNGNRVHDQGEPGLEGMRVSNGRDIVLTDADGRYEIGIDDETIIFVIKPKGWRTPFSEDMLPQFHYIHKPKGSPPSRYPGSEPTGPLPESVDFPLYRQDEPETFKVIMFGDPQPRNIREVEFVYHDVVEELIGNTDASFGVTLGDIAFDNLNTFEPQNRAIGLIGIPWYNVIGNHDQNYEARDHRYSNETFHRVYGPSHYSFEYGNVHFVVLDNVIWEFPEGAERGSYYAGLHDEQIQFVYNDLALIPEDQMVVLMMHIPITSMRDSRTLYEMIERRPFCVSISGHTHTQEHRFLTQEQGWLGPEPHHHIVNVTVCGSWWSGATDEYGIPHTQMRDGAPNGYSIMTFDGKNYDWEFKAARRPADHQMSIWAPEVIDADKTADTEIVVNVFGGSQRSTVHMRIADSDWIQLEKVVRHDPFFVEMKKIEQSDKPPTGRALPNPVNSTHLWAGKLPAGVPAGTHLIEIKTRDMFGKEYQDGRIIRVR